MKHGLSLAPAIFVLFATSANAADPSRFTEKCNTQPAVTVAIRAGAFISDIGMAVTNPASNADLYRRLWEPRGITEYATASAPVVGLYFDARQDIAQISAEIAADPVLRARGVEYVEMGALACFATAPPATPMTLTEYRNSILDHYFLSSSAQENGAIDSGAAGPGWARTGETFATIAPDFCNGSTTVHRFYGPSAHSHVFTPDPQECGIVRKAGTGWLYEGVAFGAFMPRNGECLQGNKPVWRLYNNRAAQDDSNHRYVARQALVDEMTGRGWVLEGVAFCVNP